MYIHTNLPRLCNDFDNIRISKSSLRINDEATCCFYFKFENFQKRLEATSQSPLNGC